MEYDILGCSPNDSFDTIKSRYRALALRHHPDRKTGDRAIFDLVTEAFAYIQKHNVDAPTDFRAYRIDDDVRISQTHKTVEFTAFSAFDDGHAGWTTGSEEVVAREYRDEQSRELTVDFGETAASGPHREWLVRNNYIELPPDNPYSDIAEVHIDQPEPLGTFDEIPELTGPFEYKPLAPACPPGSVGRVGR